MKNRAIFLALVVLLILACSGPTLFSTPTPVPTNTPLPTNTPTNTPTPIVIPGVTVPVRYMGVSFTATGIKIASSWDFGSPLGTQYPTAIGDIFLAVILKYEGDLNQVTFPQETNDPEITFHVEDNNGRVNQWARIEPATEDTIIIVFVVDGSATDYTFTLPGGQEINLASFLTQ